MSVTFLNSAGNPPTLHADSDRWRMWGTLTFSGSYTTGGVAWDPTTLLSVLGAGVIDFIDINPVAGYVFSYDYTAKKVLIFTTGASSGAAGAELAASTFPAAVSGSTNIKAMVLGL